MVAQSEVGRFHRAAIISGISALALFTGAAAIAQTPRGTDGASVSIRRTAYGVPHVRAKTMAGAGYGVGYAFAEDNACEMARYWVQMRGELSKTFGPEDGNVASDVFWTRINQDKVIEKQLREKGFRGPLPEVRELVRGYAAGYNQYLKDVGYHLSDPRCASASWIKPITEKDVYLRALAWALLANVQPKANGMGLASPPGAPSALPASGTTGTRRSRPGASNMVALGGDASVSGNALLMINPHWTWDAPFRFYEAHLTVPGRLNAAGMTSMGLPLLIIGYNQTLGWSHTYSAAMGAVIYKLSLQPGQPTSYMVDGRARPMTSTNVSVEVKQPDGSLRREQHRMWDTAFGPVYVTDKEPWTTSEAYALNIKDMNLRWMNQDFMNSKAQTVEELYDAGKKAVGWGFLNTAAIDSTGKAFFGTLQSVPLLTNAQLEECKVGPNSEIAKTVFMLDGSRSACKPGADGKALVAGIYPGDRLPGEFRNDYLINSNDSHWMPNVRSPMTGYPRAMGAEAVSVSLRSRNSLNKMETRLNGTDGLPGNKFTLATFFGKTQDNSSFSGRLWRDDLVTLCQTLESTPDTLAACSALQQWNLNDDLDSPGAVLFHLFVDRLDDPANETPSATLFAVPFDPKDPINTPRGLNTALPKVKEALLGAIADLRAAKAPMTATLRQFQFAEKGTERVPVYGGSGMVGDMNLLDLKPWDPSTGWLLGPGGGASFQAFVEMTKNGPVGMSLLTASQSTNPASPHFLDQTLLFSKKIFKPFRFSEQDIAADPELKVTSFCLDSRYRKVEKAGGCGAR